MMTNRETFCKANAIAKEIRGCFERYRDAFAFAFAFALCEIYAGLRAGKLLARKIFFDAVSRQWTQQRPGCRPGPLCDELMDALRI